MRPEPADRLSPTARPGSARRLLKIVILLVVLAHIIAGAAWLVGQRFYEKDEASVATRQPPLEAPPRPAGGG